MLRLESEDLCVDISGFESVEAIAGYRGTDVNKVR